MTPGRLKIWNEDAGEWQYTPGGDPSSLRWSNVATITYADIIAAATNPIDVATLPTGTFIDGYYLNQTVAFDDTGSIDYLIGWDLAGTPRPLGSQNFPTPLPGDAGGANDWSGATGNASGQFSIGATIPADSTIGVFYGPLVLDAATAGALQMVFASINGDGETGSFDVWLRTQAPA